MQASFPLRTSTVLWSGVHSGHFVFCWRVQVEARIADDEEEAYHIWFQVREAQVKRKKQ